MDSVREEPYFNLDKEESTVKRFIAKQSLSSVLNSPVKVLTYDSKVFSFFTN